MNRFFLCGAILFISATICEAQTYSWTDKKGIAHFTDNLETVPPAYRKKMMIRPGITLQDPGISEEIELQRQRALEEEAARPPITISPSSPPPPPEEESANKEDTPNEEASKTPPPPRTKSQKIRDNLKRRALEEEKAKEAAGSR